MGLNDYAAVLVFGLVGLGFVLFTIYILGWFLRPSRPSANKQTTYECGELPVGEAQVQFRVIFYLYVLLFVIFDVEVAYIVPWAAVLQSLSARGHGLFALAEMFVFIAVLALGLAYAWRKGVLRWD